MIAIPTLRRLGALLISAFVVLPKGQAQSESLRVKPPRVGPNRTSAFMSEARYTRRNDVPGPLPN